MFPLCNLYFKPSMYVLTATSCILLMFAVWDSRIGLWFQERERTSCLLYAACVPMVIVYHPYHHPPLAWPHVPSALLVLWGLTLQEGLTCRVCVRVSWVTLTSLCPFLEEDTPTTSTVYTEPIYSQSLMLSAWRMPSCESDGSSSLARTARPNPSGGCLHGNCNSSSLTSPQPPPKALPLPSMLSGGGCFSGIESCCSAQFPFKLSAWNYLAQKRRYCTGGPGSQFWPHTTKDPIRGHDRKYWNWSVAKKMESGAANDTSGRICSILQKANLPPPNMKTLERAKVCEVYERELTLYSWQQIKGMPQKWWTKEKVDDLCAVFSACVSVCAATGGLYGPTVVWGTVCVDSREPL